MRFRFLPALMLALTLAPPLHAQDTTAIKAYVDTITRRATNIDMDVDTVRKDKSRPAYVKRADVRIDTSAQVISRAAQGILNAMRPKPDSQPPQPPSTVAKIEIHATATTVAVGSTLQLVADPRDSANKPVAVPVSWRSSDAAIGDVSGTGLLTGKKAGTVIAFATAQGVTGQRAFTVTGTSPPDSGGGTVPPTPPDTTTPIAGFDGPAELPRALPTVAYTVPCAVTVVVAQSMDLQQQLNMIQPGGCLALAQGATFTGNYTLPNKGTSSAWVSVFTNGVQLPPPGTRITPTKARALNFAKIQSPGYNPTIATAAGAHHYRFLGVEIAPAASAQTTGVNMIVALYDQSAQWSIAGVPHDLQFIQVYVHGSSTLDVRRCFRGDARMFVVVDSWVADCHSNQTDSQAFLFLSGAANVLARNNHLEAGHQVMMSGGGDPPDSSMSPHDIAILNNHIYHPASWKGVWQGKTVVETKNVRRLIVEGNVVENSWPDAQAGFCLLLKSENQNGTAPYTTTSDVIVRFNVWLRCGSWANISGTGSSANPNIPATAMSLHDNRVDSVGKFGGDGIAVQALSGARKIVYQKNTILNGLQGFYSNQAISFDGAPQQAFTFSANIVGHGQYGVKGSGTSDGTSTLNQYAPGAVFTSNAIVGGCGTYPAGNSCPATVPAPSTTVGADLVAIAQKTAGVVVTDSLMPGAIRRGGPLPRVKWKASPTQCQKPGILPASCDRPIQP